MLVNKEKKLEKLPKEVTLQLRQKHIGRSVTLFFQNDPLKIVKGVGQYMYDEEGNEYLDCINNVAHVGHCHPHVVKAATEQMSLLYTNSRYLHDNLVIYAKRLTDYFPNKLSICYFVNSGSEANDLAMRLARCYTKHEDVICLDGAYHGHLTTTIDISPYKFTKINNGAKKDWVHVAPMPCSYRGEYTTDDYSESQIGQLYAQEVQKIINNVQNNGRKIGAFICESMISCGGQIVLPQNYLRNVYKFVRAAGGVCIADEVQVGFGRTGHMWAFEQQGPDAVPDIVTLGKPIGNGHPLACVVTTKEIAESFNKIGTEYFNTYGGNPVSLAVANAVLDIIESDTLIDHGLKVGGFMMKALNILKEKYEVIGDIRGAAMFLGVDIVVAKKTKEPAPQIADYIVKRFKQEKVLMSTEGKYGNVLKFKPPMTFTIENAQRWLKTLETILEDIHFSEQNSRLSSESGSLSMESLNSDNPGSSSISEEEF